MCKAKVKVKAYFLSSVDFKIGWHGQNYGWEPYQIAYPERKAKL